MSNNQKGYKDIKINPLPEREVEILGSITQERMSDMRAKALMKLREEVELPGFRKGNAPENLVAQKIGEARLLEEAAEMALQDEYPKIIDENKIDAIGRPEITITKLAPGNPLEFKIKTYLMPEVKLEDYKKIAKDINKKEKSDEVKATEKEVEDVIKNIRWNIAHEKLHRDNPELNTHDHPEIKDEDLPLLDENLLKMIGDFKSVDELKEKINENIQKEKEAKEKDKRRVKLIESVIEKSKIDLPKIIIDGELDKMMAQFEDDIAKSGLSIEQYLTHIKKSIDDIKSEWKETATKRAKSQVILNEIAKEEGIAAKEEDIKKEMEHILSHHKDADRFRVRMYVDTFLTNELVFQFLENIR
jgi:FKBP-type peptidyl-prolyl cis-trans isomerase (trigger factor)